MRVTALALLDGDHTILRDLAHSLSEEFTDFLIIVGRYRSHLLNLVVVVTHLLSALGDMIRHGLHSLVDTTLQIHRVGTGGDILQTLGHDSLSQDGSGGRTVAGIVTSLRGDALHELCARILKLVLQLDLLGDGHTVLGNLGSTELLFNNHVAALRTECYLDGICQLVDALLQQVTRLNIEFYILCHNFKTNYN